MEPTVFIDQSIAELPGHPGYVALIDMLKKDCAVYEALMAAENDEKAFLRIARIWQPLRRIVAFLENQPQMVREKLKDLGMGALGDSDVGLGAYNLN